MNLLQMGLQQINLLQMSLVGAVFIAAVALIRMIAKNRLPKAAFLALWYLALIRLLLPVTVPFPFSIYSMMRNTFPALDALGNVAANGAADFAAGTAPAQPDATGFTNGTVSLQPDAIGTNTLLPITQNGRETVSVLFLIWITGAAIMAGFFIIRWLRCRREFQTALPVRNSSAALWIRQHPLRRTMEIRQLTGLSTPLTYGIFRPVILMPKDTDWQNESQLAYILYHEYVHIRRFDGIGKLAASAALCLHWFNPLVWLLYFLFNQDIELSCDESVLRHFGSRSRKDYAATLLCMEEQRNRPVPFGSYFSKNATEERIKSIMKFKKKTTFTLISALIIVVLGTIAIFTASPKAADTKTSPFDEVLRGETSFLCVSGDSVESLNIKDVPTFFSPEDPETRIWNFTAVDLDKDGNDEVVLSVYGAGGSTGGFLILHQKDGQIYGYANHYRMLNSLKSDGTFSYSDLIGEESGTASITAFSATGYTLDKISYGLGSQWSFDTFVVNHQPATEEEFLATDSEQAQKPDAEWYAFTDENIASIFYNRR